MKRLKPTNTRLKQQFEEFWEPKKTQRGAGRFSAPPPFVVFSATLNCSDWCLSLVFVGFNLLILCWLAGANDEVIVQNALTFGYQTFGYDLGQNV